MHHVQPKILKAAESVMRFGMVASISGGVIIGTYLAAQTGTMKEAIDNALWSIFVVGLSTAIAFDFAADSIHYINAIGQRAALQQQGTNSMEDLLLGVPPMKGLSEIVGAIGLHYSGKHQEFFPSNYVQMQKV